MVIKKSQIKTQEEFIEKGAKVKSDVESLKKEWSHFHLRIRKDMLESIDNAVNQEVGITRTGWILQAIHKKLNG